MTFKEAVCTQMAHWPVKVIREDGRCYCEKCVTLRIALQDSEDQEKSFDLRWKSDMRAIKMWQEAHPGNDSVWPSHDDLCVWLMDQLTISWERIDSLKAKLSHQAVLTGGPQEQLDKVLKENRELRGE